jgi:cyanophycinase
VTVHLVGGGADTTTPGLLAPFLAEVVAAAGRAGHRPRIAVVVVDRWGSGRRSLPGYVHALDAGRDVDVAPVFLRRGRGLLPETLAGVDGIVVGGGPTPEYLEGLSGSAGSIAAAVRAGTPYLGFSAGAMIAPRSALVGGHLQDGRGVCPEEWSEELDELTVAPGLGLVGFPVDVHTAQAGTLGRTVALVGSGAAPVAVGIDEDTCLAVAAQATDPADGVVTGAGGVWMVRPGPDGATAVTRRTAD